MWEFLYQSNAVFAFDDASVPMFFHNFVETVHTTLWSYTFLTACQLERMFIYKSIAVPSFCMNVWIYTYMDIFIWNGLSVCLSGHFGMELLSQTYMVIFVWDHTRCSRHVNRAFFCKLWRRFSAWESVRCYFQKPRGAELLYLWRFPDKNAWSLPLRAFWHQACLKNFVQFSVQEWDHTRCSRHVGTELFFVTLTQFAAQT